MKKLMVIAALMCAAVSAQAEMWYVHISSIQGPDGQFYKGQMTISCEALQYEKTFDYDTFWQDMPYLDSDDGTNYDFALTATSTSGNKTYTYLYESQFAGWQKEVTISTGGGTWTETTPEPTSGLLLLIGMAGLALKRKRA